MSVHFITATLGGGKSLISVDKARPYLNSGRPVATNLDLFFDKYPDSYTTDKPYCIRLPDHPSSQDLKDLGYGNTTPDESKNGLLIFDECGTWFNSHGWNSPDRKEFTDVLLHIRKLGWDCIFIVQHFEMVDKQARQAICEYLVTCRRMDKMNIPVLSFLTKLFTGKPFPLPRVHIGKVMYGYDAKAIQSDRWTYRGTELFDFYDTKQIFSPSYPHGSYCYLKPSNFHYDKATKLKAKKDYSRRSIERLWHLRPPELFFFILGLAVSMIFGGIFSFVGSAGDPNIDIESKEELALPSESSSETFDSDNNTIDIRLSGVFRYGDTRHFYFRLNGEPYNPAKDGFAYLPYGKCGAILVRDDFRKTLYCSSDDV